MSLAAALAIGAVIGVAVARPRHESTIELEGRAEPVSIGCSWACRARQAHLEQLVDYWRTEAAR